MKKWNELNRVYGVIYVVCKYTLVGSLELDCVILAGKLRGGIGFDEVISWDSNKASGASSR